MRKVFFCCMLGLLGNLRGQAQLISLKPVMELHYQESKGSIRLPISNQGLEPLLILELKSSHPQCIELKLAPNPILPSHLSLLVIQYDFRKETESAAKIIIIRSNSIKKNKVSIELVPAIK